MSISLLLEMATSDQADRVAVVSDDVRLTAARLSALAGGGSEIVTNAGADHLVYVGTGGAMLPVLMFSAARAGRPFCPLNYRLSRSGIETLINRLPNPLVVADTEYMDGISAVGQRSSNRPSSSKLPS